MNTAGTVKLDLVLPDSIPNEEARLMLALKLYERGGSRWGRLPAQQVVPNGHSSMCLDAKA